MVCPLSPPQFEIFAEAEEMCHNDASATLPREEFQISADAENLWQHNTGTTLLVKNTFIEFVDNASANPPHLRRNASAPNLCFYSPSTLEDTMADNMGAPPAQEARVGARAPQPWSEHAATPRRVSNEFHIKQPVWFLSTYRKHFTPGIVSGFSDTPEYVRITFETSGTFDCHSSFVTMHKPTSRPQVHSRATRVSHSRSSRVPKPLRAKIVTKLFRNHFRTSTDDALKPGDSSVDTDTTIRNARSVSDSFSPPCGFQQWECTPADESGNCYYCCLSYVTAIGIRALRFLLACRSESGTTKDVTAHILRDRAWASEIDMQLTAKYMSDIFPDGILLYRHDLRAWIYFMPFTGERLLLPANVVASKFNSGWSPITLEYTCDHFRLLQSGELRLHFFTTTDSCENIRLAGSSASFSERCTMMLLCTTEGLDFTQRTVSCVPRTLAPLYKNDVSPLLVIALGGASAPARVTCVSFSFEIETIIISFLFECSQWCHLAPVAQRFQELLRRPDAWKAVQPARMGFFNICHCQRLCTACVLRCNYFADTISARRLFIRRPRIQCLQPGMYDISRHFDPNVATITWISQGRIDPVCSFYHIFPFVDTASCVVIGFTSSRTPSRNVVQFLTGGIENISFWYFQILPSQIGLFHNGNQINSIEHPFGMQAFSRPCTLTVAFSPYEAKLFYERNLLCRFDIPEQGYNHASNVFATLMLHDDRFWVPCTLPRNVIMGAQARLTFLPTFEASAYAQLFLPCIAGGSLVNDTSTTFRWADMSSDSDVADDAAGSLAQASCNPIAERTPTEHRRNATKRQRRRQGHISRTTRQNTNNDSYPRIHAAIIQQLGIYTCYDVASCLSRLRASWFHVARVLLHILNVPASEMYFHTAPCIVLYDSVVPFLLSLAYLRPVVHKDAIITPQECDLTAKLLHAYAPHGFRITLLAHSSGAVLFHPCCIPSLVSRVSCANIIPSIVVDSQGMIGFSNDGTSTPMFASGGSPSTSCKRKRYQYDEKDSFFEFLQREGTRFLQTPTQANTTLFAEVASRNGHSQLARTLDFQRQRMLYATTQLHTASVDMRTWEVFTEWIMGTTLPSSIMQMNTEEIEAFWRLFRLVRVYPAAYSVAAEPVASSWKVVLDFPFPRLVNLLSLRHRNTWWTATFADVTRELSDVLQYSAKTLVSASFLQWLQLQCRMCVPTNTVLRLLLCSHIQYLTSCPNVSSSPFVFAAMQLVSTRLPSVDLVARLNADMYAYCLEGIWNQHQREVIFLDGCGWRIDAEFKLCRRVQGISHNRLRMNLRRGSANACPWRASFCARGPVGLYLSDLALSSTGETGLAYLLWLVGLFRIRRERLEAQDNFGLPIFVCIDYAPTYKAFVLAAVAYVWPEFMVDESIGHSTATPHSYVHNAHVRKDVVLICSDPWHRVLRIQQRADSKHPDYADIISDTRLAMWRLNSAKCLLTHSFTSGSEMPGLSEQAQDLLRRWLQRQVGTQSMFDDATVNNGSINEIRRFIASKDVLHHPLWVQLCGHRLPHGRLLALARDLKSGVHPLNDSYRYTSSSHFRDALDRIVDYYKTTHRASKRRCVIKEDAQQDNNIFILGVSAPHTVSQEFVNIFLPEMFDSLWNWWKVSDLLDLRLPVGTTNVEGAFHALRQAMGIIHGRYSFQQFTCMCRMAVIALNFYILSRGQMPQCFRKDWKLFYLIQTVTLHALMKTRHAFTSDNSAALRDFESWLQKPTERQCSDSGHEAARGGYIFAMPGEECQPRVPQLQLSETPRGSSGLPRKTHCVESKHQAINVRCISFENDVVLITGGALGGLEQMFTSADGFSEGPASATIEDPFLINGSWNHQAFFQALRTSIQNKAHEMNIALEEDYNNVCDHPDLIDVIIDLRIVWQDIGTAIEMREFLEHKLSFFHDEESFRLSLDALYNKHIDYDPFSMYPRTFASSHIFMGKAFGVHSQYAAIPFNDNTLAFSPCFARIVDDSMPTRITRGSILLAYTGMGKSPLLRFVYDTVVSTPLMQQCQASFVPAVKSMADFEHVISKTTNLNELYNIGKKYNMPCGLRVFVEEISHLLNKTNGRQDKAKLDPVDLITVIDPAFDAGKNVASHRVHVENLRVILTAGCQPNKLHEYLPHSLEGESFRIEIVGTPVHESTSNKIRANKTTSKDGIRGFWQAIYCKLIEHFSGQENFEIVLDMKTRSMIALLEEVSKSMLQTYKNKFPTRAEQDPFYYFMNGKVDSKMIINVAECFLQRVALLKCIFPSMPIRMTTHEIDGRMAIRKTLFQVMERRGMINHVLEQLYANKRLWNSVFNELAIPPCRYVDDALAKRARVNTETPDAPTLECQARSREITIAKTLWDSRDTNNIIVPRISLTAMHRSFGQKACRYMIDLIPFFSTMSVKFHLVMATGRASDDADSPCIVWDYIEPGQTITATRRNTATGKGKGSGGGKPMVPYLFVRGSGTVEVQEFLEPFTRIAQDSTEDDDVPQQMAPSQPLTREARIEQMDMSQPDEPEHIHAQAMQLVREHQIEPTTAEQRARNRPKSAFECPPNLMPLLQYGYVSPNYGWAPQGTQWVSTRGVFRLVPRGG